VARLTANVSVNFVGHCWAALIQIIFLPLYLRLLGAEQFGLIAFYGTLQGALLILDLGIGPTLARELARRSIDPTGIDASRDLLRTIELIYITIGAMVGSAIVIAAPWIAAHWLRAGTVPEADVRSAIRLMGVLVAFQWPLSLYQGGLIGLERQLPLNAIKIAMTSFAAVGSLVLLSRVSATTGVFFAWQAGVFGLYVLATRGALWRSLPSTHRPRWTAWRLRSVWRFSAGMTAITLTAVILTQADKLFLSKVVSLGVFGFYALAATLCGGLMILVTPLFNGLFPRFSALVAAGDENALRRLYHEGTQYMASLTLPIAVSISAFARPLVYFWTANSDVASVTGPILTILVIGTALNGLMNVPYALQLAHGWTALGFRINLFLIALMAPSLFFLFRWYGPVGAAGSWVIINAAYVAIGVWLTHRRLLRGETRRWFLHDVAPPLFVSVAAATACRLGLPIPATRIGGGAECALAAILALVLAVLVTPVTRHRLRTLSLGAIRSWK
jgi:O-antigen/teichoic acid export membrane protein